MFLDGWVVLRYRCSHYTTTCWVGPSSHSILITSRPDKRHLCISALLGQALRLLPCTLRAPLHLLALPKLPQLQFEQGILLLDALLCRVGLCGTTTLSSKCIKCVGNASEAGYIMMIRYDKCVFVWVMHKNSWCTRHAFPSRHLWVTPSRLLCCPLPILRADLHQQVFDWLMTKVGQWCQCRRRRCRGRWCRRCRPGNS